MNNIASLTVYCGPMFAGKSTALLSAVAASPSGQCMLLKPEMDGRYGRDVIATHDKHSMPASPIRSMPAIPSHIRHVFLDEVQFMEDPWFDGVLTEDVAKLLLAGCHVHAAGLDMDAWGVPFQVTACLLAMADNVVKLKAACACGAPACLTMLKPAASSHNRILLGGSDVYEPACRTHWTLPT